MEDIRRFLRRHISLVCLAGIVVVWEIIGRANVLGGQAIPPPSEVLSQLWTDRGFYPSNLATTLREAALGFVLGNCVALVAAFVFVEIPRAERALSGLVVVLFSMPIIAAAPVLAIAFEVDTAKVLLAAIAVIFPTLINTVVGLRSVDQAVVDMIVGFGGNSRTVLRKARIRAAIPGMVVGFQLAAPAALLGAILGEFLGGTSGLGVFMMNSMAQFETARTWGAGLVSTLIAGGIFAAFALLGRHLAAKAASPTIGLGTRQAGSQADASIGARVGRSAVNLVMGLCVVLIAWYGFIVIFGLNRLFAKTPLAVAQFLQEPANRDRVLHALGQTVPLAVVGLLAGMLVALIGAVIFVLVPEVERAALPLALVLQSVPLAALAPVLIIVLGRGTVSTVVISMFVTFFASLVTLAEGLRAAPRGAIDLLLAYNASRWTIMTKVQLPNAVPYGLAAARLAAPRALLGVMIAEWLATGIGIGGDLQNARFILEFDVVWAEAAVATLFAVIAYQLIGVVESAAIRRFAPQSLAA